MDKRDTLWKKWKYNAGLTPDKDAIVHWVAEEEPVRWTFKSLIETAGKFSHGIYKAGIKKNDVCAIIIRHNPFLYPLYMGISRAGALPAILAYPNPRLHPDKFRQGLEGMAQRSGLDYIFTERELEPLIKPLIEKPGSTIKAVFFPLEWDINSPVDKKTDAEIESIAQSVKETDYFLVQHSSGTTGLQKPIAVTHKMLLEHVDICNEALNAGGDDKVVSWLPLYHDMGLIGCLHIPLASGMTSIHISPFEWVLAPILLLEVITKEKGTISYIPNFAYNFLAEKIPVEELEDIDLGSLRLLINGSEPIRHDSHQKFIERFKKYNFNPLALMSIYGMAELTLALTYTEPGKPLTELYLDRNKLSEGRVVKAGKDSVVRICVSCGKLVRGADARIFDVNRRELPDTFVGEIAVKSVSMFEGYRNYPEKTAEVVHDGWYFTGDYGFKCNDEFYVIARKKDLIIVAGKNIYPEDIEDAVNQVEGILPGRVIAFGEEDSSLGTEKVSVVAETKLETDKDKNRLRIDILKAGMSIDINIGKVYLAPPRWLIKSSAGKPSRRANKERLTLKEDPQIWSR